MKRHDTRNSIDRRQWLRGATALAGGLTFWPLAGCSSTGPRSEGAASSAAAGTSPPRHLILIQMFGGNDSLNTLVPYGDDAYFNHRPKTHIAERDVLKIDDYCGFTPALENLHRLYQEGQVAFVQGVGYPNPVLSHFKSLDIWHAASTSGNPSGEGWVARTRKIAWPDDDRGELIAHVGKFVPNSILAASHKPLTFKSPKSFTWLGADTDREHFERGVSVECEHEEPVGREAMLAKLRGAFEQAQATSPRILAAVDKYEAKVEYPAGVFGDSLRSIAAMIHDDFPTRVYSVDIRGFDTHAKQRPRQDDLLREVDRGVAALLKDLENTPGYEDTLVMGFSEFGRRVSENYSLGTDHGAGGCMFFAGPRVNGGLYGERPSLTELTTNENLIYNVDFRRAYASVIEGWYGIPNERVLGDRWDPLPVIRA